ncbi:MAG: hypothetical protein WC119_01840 [Synergistaceae bacterium]
MKIALRCKECRVTWMQGEEDLCLEIDFYDQKIFFVCPNCKHENRMDIETWKKKQEHSPLPRIGTM